MQPSQIQSLIRETIQRLRLDKDPQAKYKLNKILTENAPDAQKFRRAISSIEKMHESDRKDVYAILETNYQDERSTFYSENCDYCRGTGWLKAVQMCGNHNKRSKTWIFNFNKKDSQEKFLKANKTFTAQVMKYPCGCANGNERNQILIHSGEDWLKPEQRRSIMGKVYISQCDRPDEMDAEEEYINYQMMNRINGFKKGLDLPVYSVNRNISRKDSAGIC